MRELSIAGVHLRTPGLIGALRTRVSKAAFWLFKRIGYQSLTKEETFDYLRNSRLAQHPANQIPLPAVPDAAIPTKTVFGASEAVTEPAYVWLHERRMEKTRQLPLGSVQVGSNVLYTDYDGDRGIGRAVLWPPRRASLRTDTLIAPWSHSIDGDRFGGYYDFMAIIAAKLCRIKDALPPSVLDDAVVAYPLFGTDYEREVLTLLGFRPDQVVDSRFTQVTFDRCVLANSGDWVYPNAADLQLLRRQLEQVTRPQPTEQHRVYIARAGRRRVVNEDAVIDLLKQHRFTIIDDIPRSIAEQITIYKNAEFIIGPHGASFTNVIWCEPGAHLLELFAPGYMPDHFRYMSRVFDVHYSAYFHGSTAQPELYQQKEDMYVSVPELQRALERIGV